MKLYMIRKTLEDGTKEYASAGIRFSPKSSKGWGRIGNLKLAIKNRLYSVRVSSDSYDKAFIDWLEWENCNGLVKIDIVEIDIDDVTIVETPISIWYEQNMKQEGK